MAEIAVRRPTVDLDSDVVGRRYSQCWVSGTRVVSSTGPKTHQKAADILKVAKLETTPRALQVNVI